MSEDTLYKRLSDELKPYYENSDCCTYIGELRKYKREAIKEIVKAWRTIYAILQATGYVEMYQDEITTIVNFIKENSKEVNK